MKDTPVIFQGPMVHAIMREIEQPYTGKTNTRRMAWLPARKPESGKIADAYQRPSPWQKCAAGDRLWVRESYWAWGEWKQTEDMRNGAEPGDSQWSFWHHDHVAPLYHVPPGAKSIKREAGRLNFWKRPSIHMPRAHSRITLEVTSVKVERLQAVSEADARREGVRCYGPPPFHYFVDGMEPTRADSAIGSFRLLWESINGADAWDSNPEVIAIEFKPHLANIDAMPKPEAA